MDNLKLMLQRELEKKGIYKEVQPVQSSNRVRGSRCGGAYF